MPSWGYFEPSRPIEVSGGIKLQSKKKGESGGWATRWIASLESFYMGSRLQSGRAYARKGQVTRIDVEAGLVTADVQGSQRKPYSVEIGMRTLADDEKKRIAEALAERPLLIAKLLAGELPPEISDLFSEQKVVFFPSNSKDLKTSCDCPDSSNPCKHIAAVFYILGEQFDRDPFLIMKLRGLDREDLLAGLSSQAAEHNATQEIPAAPPQPIDAAIYWRAAAGKSDESSEASHALPHIPVDLRLPPIPAALPRQLGVFPFWRGDRPLLDVLPELYTTASKGAVELLSGERINSGKPDVNETNEVEAAPVRRRGRRLR